MNSGFLSSGVSLRLIRLTSAASGDSADVANSSAGSAGSAASVGSVVGAGARPGRAAGSGLRSRDRGHSLGHERLRDRGRARLLRRQRAAGRADRRPDAVAALRARAAALFADPVHRGPASWAVSTARLTRSSAAPPDRRTQRGSSRSAIGGPGQDPSRTDFVESLALASEAEAAAARPARRIRTPTWPAPIPTRWVRLIRTAVWTRVAVRTRIAVADPRRRSDRYRRVAPSCAADSSRTAVLSRRGRELPSPDVPHGSGGRWERARLAASERLPLWVQSRCGTDPRALAALLLVLVVGVGFAVQHFWTGRPEPVRAPAVERAEAAPGPRSGPPPLAKSPPATAAGAGAPDGHRGPAVGRRCRGEGPESRHSPAADGIAGYRCAPGRGRCAARCEYPWPEPGPAAGRR